jgi:hypothetical protein
MKKLFNLVRIYRYYRNPKLITKPYWSLNALRKLRNNYEKHSFESNLIAGLIKKLRSIAPYQVEDFSGAKKLYDDYFKLPNAIQSIEELNDLLAQSDVYVTRFRDDIPVKGKRFCEYYINGSFGRRNGVFKIDKTIRNYDSPKLESLSGSYNFISESTITQYVYSTKEEIEKYEKAEELVDEKLKQIDLLKDKIYKLRKEINSIYDC